MLMIGDIHVYVADFSLALRFWSDGLRLKVLHKEVGQAAAYAELECAAGGPSVHLLGGAEPWPAGARPAVGARPTVRFDVLTTEFDDTLVRLLEHGGEQVGEIEEYESWRLVTLADPDGNTFDLIETPEGADDEDGDE